MVLHFQVSVPWSDYSRVSPLLIALNQSFSFAVSNHVAVSF